MLVVRFWPRRGVVLAAVFACASGCGNSDSPAASDKATEPAQTTTQAAPGADAASDAPPPQVTPAPPRYEASVGGLQSLMTALIEAIQSDEPGEKARLLASMRLPDPEAWFREHFGAKLAKNLLAEYEPQRLGIGRMLAALQPVIDQGRTVPRAEVFEGADQVGATGYQQQALRKMKKKTPLYSVRLSTPDSKRPFHVWSFVHVDGTFRYVGKMKAIAGSQAPAEGPDPMEFRALDRDKVEAARPQ